MENYDKPVAVFNTVDVNSYMAEVQSAVEGMDLSDTVALRERLAKISRSSFINKIAIRACDVRHMKSIDASGELRDSLMEMLRNEILPFSLEVLINGTIISHIVCDVEFDNIVQWWKDNVGLIKDEQA